MAQREYLRFHLAEPQGSDWRFVLVACVLLFLVVLGVRLSEFSRWDDDAYFIDGEYLMTAFDTYHWLAGAEGVGGGKDTPMAELLRWVSAITGVTTATAAFWLPAILASLVAMVIYLWGWLLGGITAGLAAALIGALSPAFLIRSRLGYFDTDLFTLLVPLYVTWSLALIIRPNLPLSWFGSSRVFGTPKKWWTYSITAFCLGLIGWFGGLFHYHAADFSVIAFVVASVLVLLLAPLGCRAGATFNLLCFAVPLLLLPEGFSILEIVVSVGILSLVVFRAYRESDFERIFNYRWVCAIALIAIIVVGPGVALAQGVAHFANSYVPSLSLGSPEPPVIGIATSNIANEVAQGPEKSSSMPIYPKVGSSIIELQPLSLKALLNAFTAFWWFGVFGIAAFLIVLVIRPIAVLLLPLLALALLAVNIGERLAMFGGPIVALGAGVIVSGTISSVGKARGEWLFMQLLAQLTLVAVLLIPWTTFFLNTSSRPVLGSHLAKALRYLDLISPAESTVWVWWDWGYAAQYYAKRKTPSDGSSHSGEDIYATAVALSTASAHQASQLMQLSAAHDHQLKSFVGSQSGTSAMDTIDSLKSNTADLRQVPPQYLVVHWEAIGALGWLSHFGNWDLSNGMTHRMDIRPLGGSFSFDIERGEIESKETGATFSVSAAGILEQGRVRKLSYPHETGSYLLANTVTGQTFLLDKEGFSSMLVQLLVSDPGSTEIRSNFELVFEDLPFVRVYRAITTSQATSQGTLIGISASTRSSPTIDR